MNYTPHTVLKHFLSASSSPGPPDQSPELRVFAKGELIVAESKPATDFHLICRGRVQLIKQHPGGQASRTTTLFPG